MKIIALTPVKNEALILPFWLATVSLFCDKIIIADQMSSDGSRSIYPNFPKVSVIDNKSDFHSNVVRWQLLDEARKIPGDKLILLLDADECFPPILFNEFITECLGKYKKGQIFSFKWVQLWKSVDFYNCGGVWKDNNKSAAFIDNGVMDYDRSSYVLNDHTSRVPMINALNDVKFIEALPLLHFQWINWPQVQMKQAWYRCSELISKKRKSYNVNSTYAITLDSPQDQLLKVPRNWIEEIKLPNHYLVYEVDRDWHYNQIIEWFDSYGILFFEELQIWHIKELRDKFINKYNREPLPRLNPPLWRIFARKIKSLLI